MELRVLGSSSRGNCYLLEASDGTLILELGVGFGQVRKALRWNLAKVAAAVVTHRHSDHSKYLRDAVARGIDVLAPVDTLEHYGLRDGALCHVALHKGTYRFGRFRIKALSVDHDVPCMAYVIDHPEMGRLLFVTDTMVFRYSISKWRCDHLMIEANYGDRVLDGNIAAGRESAAMRPRLMRSHMEISTTEGILRDNDTGSVQEVILVHLSGRNSDPDEFRRRIEETSGKPAVIAVPGLTITLNAPMRDDTGI